MFGKKKTSKSIAKLAKYFTTSESFKDCVSRLEIPEDNVIFEWLTRYNYLFDHIGERSLKDTEYADDAALLAETLMAVVALTNYGTT